MTIVIVIEHVNKQQKALMYRDVQKFETLTNAKAWLKDESHGHKLTKIYRDLKNGSSIHVGFIWAYWEKYSDTNKQFIHEVRTEFINEQITLIDLEKGLE